MFEILDQVLFTVLEIDVTVGSVVAFVLSCLLIIASYQLVVRLLLPRYFQKKGEDDSWKKNLYVIVRRLIYPLFVIAFLQSFDLDRMLYQTATFDFHLSSIMVGVIIIQLAHIADFVTSQLLRKKYQDSHSEIIVPGPDTPHYDESISKTVKYIVYTLAIIVLVGTFDINRTLLTVPINQNPFNFRVSSIFVAILIFLSARLISWVVTQLLLFSYYSKNDVDTGKRFAINQLVTYFIYVVAIFVMVDNLGIDLTVVWGGLAALLVGIGLGMQDIFKDLLSGIILLSDRTVEVHDVVNVNGKVGKIKRIGIRTSELQGQDDTTMILPNSHLVSGPVSNWTHNDKKVRFTVSVGVAYGSDPEVVKDLLMQAAREHRAVLGKPKPFVRFTDFGDSALLFDLCFWSYQLMMIENVKSDLRFQINALLVENNIQIPFPQRDIWIRNAPGEPQT